MARFLSGCVAVPICDSRPPLLWGELIIILRSLQETRIFTMLTTSAFAQTSGAAASGGASFIVQLLPLLLIFVVFYFLLIRPQQKKMKEHRTAIEAVKKGDQVITGRSDEHTSEPQSLMRISYAVFCLKKKKQQQIK